MPCSLRCGQSSKSFGPKVPKVVKINQLRYVLGEGRIVQRRSGRRKEGGVRPAAWLGSAFPKVKEGGVPFDVSRGVVLSSC
jgi:hypothetical protein